MTEESALPELGDIVGGKYRIELLLGAGGTSAVYEAKHLLTGRRFAIKWLLPALAAREEGVRRFVREAQVLGHFTHANVIEVFDFGEADGSFYMVMERLEGESLEDRLGRLGRLAPDEACRILLPCMRGVAHAHAAGVIHRDLKPANIFLCRPTDERAELPKVLDFGISRAPNLGVKLESPITQTGMWMGTPHYMSPEQVRGRGVDERSDVYAFGVILYEVLSGDVPFDSENLGELMVKIAVEPAPPLADRLPGVEPELAAIVHRAMANDPAKRFQTVTELMDALSAFASGVRGVDVALGAERAAQPRRRPLRARRSVWLGAGAAALVAVVALLVPWRQPNPPAENPSAEPPLAARPQARVTDQPAPTAAEPAAPSGTANALSPADAIPDEPPAAPARTTKAARGSDRGAAPATRADEASTFDPRARADSSTRRVRRGASDDEPAAAKPRASEAPGRSKPSSLSGVRFDMADFLPRGRSTTRLSSTPNTLR